MTTTADKFAASAIGNPYPQVALIQEYGDTRPNVEHCGCPYDALSRLEAGEVGFEPDLASLKWDDGRHIEVPLKEFLAWARGL